MIGPHPVASQDLNRFVAHHHVPRDLEIRLREYFQNRKHVPKFYSEQQVRVICKTALVSFSPHIGKQIHRPADHAPGPAQLILKMSTALQLEVSLAVHGKWIHNLPFLQQGEPNAIVAVLSKVEPRLFAPKEVPEQKQFYFVISGVVLYAARVLTAGTAWGDDFILEAKKFNADFVAYAMTHVEVYRLTRPHLLEALATFPIARRAMRKQAVIIALRHAMVSSTLQPRKLAAPL